MPANSYEIPAFGGDASKLHGWLMSATTEGESWLRAQRPTSEWDRVLQVLGPDYAAAANVVVGQSNTGYNRVAIEFEELRASLANFSHVGEVTPTEDDSQEFWDRAHMLTNLDRHWERVTFAGAQIRAGLSYALAKGTGYWYEDWDKGRWGPNIGDVRLQAIDPGDVTFVQMGDDHNIQNAYMVLIRKRYPLNLAKRAFADSPGFAAALVADGDSASWIQKGLDRVQQFLGSPILRVAGIKKANEVFPTVDIWTAYTLDPSWNQGPMPVTMGAVGTNWSYTVPALGDPIPQGILNPRTGEQHTLPATPSDCMLFPLRRLTIFSRTGIAYDGSSPWWHGEVPLTRLRFRDRPWEALGQSKIGDATSIQEGIVNLMRTIEDSAAARLNPPALYDESKVDKAWADAVNPRMAGVRAAADLSQGSPIEFPFPVQHYDVPAWIVGEGGFIKQQEERMDYVTSTRDLVAVAKARQIPSSDTLEKLLEMAGPIVQDMVGALVEPLTDLGKWRMAYYFQFYTKARMIGIADPDAQELIGRVKYIPEKLVPYRTQETEAARNARVRAYLSDFRYEVTQSGLSELNRMSRLLLLIQLSKSGAVPIDWWTMAKAARIPDFGQVPQGTNTVLERYVAQQHMVAEQQGEAAKIAAEATGGMVPGAPPAEGSPNGNGGPPEGGGAGPGRPPSFKAAPHIVNKPTEGRSTIATS